MVLVRVIYADGNMLGLQIFLHGLGRVLQVMLLRHSIWVPLSCELINGLVNFALLIPYLRIKEILILSIIFFIFYVHLLWAACQNVVPRYLFWSCSLSGFPLRLHLKLLGLGRIFGNAHSFYSLLNFALRSLLESYGLDRWHVTDYIEFYFGRTSANYLLGMLGPLQFTVSDDVDLVLLVSLWAKLINAWTSVILLNGCRGDEVVSRIVVIK